MKWTNKRNLQNISFVDPIQDVQALVYTKTERGKHVFAVYFQQSFSKTHLK